MLRYKRKTRIFFPQVLEIQSNITLEQDDFNHLIHVLRCKVGDIIGIFNNIHGEFRAEIIAINKKNLLIEVLEKIREPIVYNHNLHLAYAPLKKDATDCLLEKATELGVNTITQIISARCVNNPLDVNKINSKIINATQQCERLDVPTTNPTFKLKDFVTQYQSKAHIFWLNEFFLGSTLTTTLRDIQLIYPEIIFLIGPEGGFAQEEVDFLRQYTTAVYFNANILKAETAAIASLLNFHIIHCNF